MGGRGLDATSVRNNGNIDNRKITTLVEFFRWEGGIFYQATSNVYPSSDKINTK